MAEESRWIYLDPKAFRTGTAIANTNEQERYFCSDSAKDRHEFLVSMAVCPMGKAETLAQCPSVIDERRRYRLRIGYPVLMVDASELETRCQDCERGARWVIALSSQLGGSSTGKQDSIELGWTSGEHSFCDHSFRSSFSVSV